MSMSCRSVPLRHACITHVVNVLNMASRLLARRARNALASPSESFENSCRICSEQARIRRHPKQRENKDFLSSAHAARWFSSFPIELRAAGLSDEPSTSIPAKVIVESGIKSSNMLPRVETPPIHVSEAQVARQQHHVEETSLGSLLGVDRSILQYITDIQELERLVLVVESCSILSSEDVVSWVHSLMLATSKLDSVDGAIMTERLLAKCLELVGTQKRTTLDEYMLLPFPNAEMYNMAISAWTRARRKDCAQRATRLLQLMSHEYRREVQWIRQNCSDEEVRRVRAPRPDIINYTTVINAWGKSGTKQGILQAETMLEELEQLSGISQILLDGKSENRIEKPLAYLTPDQACYNAVITAYARSSHHEATSRIEWLLQRMDTLYERTGDTRFQPDKQSFQMLITAYARSAQQRRGKRGNRASLQAAISAENVLRVMYDRYQRARKQNSNDSYDDDRDSAEAFNVKPDVIVYNGVMNAYANSASLEGAGRAESILLGMLGESRDLGDFPIVDGILPDAITFNTAINAWAKSGDAMAGTRAERLVDIMESCDLRPNTITFNALMNAWSQSNDMRAGECVESILEHMLDKGGDAHPNVISFSTAMFALGRCEDDDGAVRAERLLDRMERLYAEGRDDSLRPNEACYDGVIFSWLCRSGNRTKYNGLHAAERAEAVLRRMNDADGIRPELKQCNRVLNAWCKHENNNGSDDGPNKVERARLLLHEMSSNAIKGSTMSTWIDSKSCQPDIFSYNYVIGCCASPFRTADRKREAFFTALDTYNRLCESPYCSPNNHTYRMMVGICVKLLPKSSDSQIEMLEKLFKECCNDGLLSNDILRTARDYLPPWLMQKHIGPGIVMHGDKPLYISDLPKEWSRQFRQKHPQGKSRPQTSS